MIGFALIEGLGGERVGEGRVAAATSAGLPVGAGERCIIGADAIAVGVGALLPGALDELEGGAARICEGKAKGAVRLGEWDGLLAGKSEIEVSRKKKEGIYYHVSIELTIFWLRGIS